MVDYVNMTGLNNLWALNFGKGISYRELKEEYPLISAYCDFYLSDEQKAVSSNSFVIDDVEISFSVANKVFMRVSVSRVSALFKYSSDSFGTKSLIELVMYVLDHRADLSIFLLINCIFAFVPQISSSGVSYKW